MFYILLSTFYVLFTILAGRRLPLAVLFVIATLPSYLIRFQVGPMPTTLLEGMVVIVFAVWLLQKMQNAECRMQNIKKFIIHNSSFIIPIMLFLAAATISMLFSPDLRAAAGIWKAYFLEPILFFIVLMDLLKNKIMARQVIAMLSITALLLSLYAIYQRFTGFGIPQPWDKELRVTSIFPYPNALGLFLAPLVPLFLTMLLRSAQRVRAYWGIVVCASVIAIVFAHSTGALVGLVAGFMCIWSLSIFQKRRQKFFILHSSFFILVIAGIIVGILTVPGIKREIFMNDWSGHVRRTQWAETIEMLKDRPILGAGLAGYKEALKPYHKATYLEIFEYPHDIVLNFWSETGLIGLFAFTLLVVLFYKISYMQKKRERTIFSDREKSFACQDREWVRLGAMGAMTALLVHGLVDVPYFKNDLAILFWIVYALGLASQSYESRS